MWVRAFMSTYIVAIKKAEPTSACVASKMIQTKHLRQRPRSRRRARRGHREATHARARKLGREIAMSERLRRCVLAG